MRILYHHRTQADDGQAVHIRSLIDALRARGHDVLEAAAVPRVGGSGSSRAPLLRRIAAATPRRFYSLLELAYDVPDHRGLCREIRRSRPDLVYVRYAMNSTAGVRAAREAGVPVFLEVNSPLVLERQREEGLAFREFFRRRESRLLRGATRVLVVSAVLRDIVVTQSGVDPATVAVIPNGVDLSRFPLPASGATTRRRLGVAEDRFLLGFVGYVRRWHDLRLVVRVMRDQVLRSRGVELLVVGDGPEVGGLLALAREGGIEDRVHVTGAVSPEEVPHALAACDVAIQPAAVAYCSPLKLFEYMAAAKPILAPDQPNVTEIVRDGKEALLFRPGDVGGFALAVLRLQDDEALRRRLGSAARRRVEEAGYTWEENAARVERLHEEWLRRRDASGPAPLPREPARA